MKNEQFPWIAHYDTWVSPKLTYRNVALYTWLDEAANEEPDSIACTFHTTNITYKELRRKAEVFAFNLREHGVGPGDRLGLMLPNLPQTVIAFWGGLKAGAIISMINPLYMEKELLHQVRDAGIRHLITIDLCWPKLERLQAQLGVEKYFITTAAEGLSFPLKQIQYFKQSVKKEHPRVPYDTQHVFPYCKLTKGEKRLSVPVGDPQKTVALLQYTGGTTGISKGVMLSHSNLGSNIQQTVACLQFLQQSPQRIMAVLPYFHVYGLTTCLLLPPILRASTIPVPRFVPTELVSDLAKYKVTILPGAPSLYIAILQSKRKKQYDLSHLRLCISGSAPMPVEYLKRFEEEFGPILVEGYGLSEASPITHLNPVDMPRKHGSIGIPLPDTEARIVDMEVGSIPLPEGKVGELTLRGPQVMLGYWNKPDETANTLRNGWLYTGDIASMDEKGFFTIVDRKKDMIIVGGYNVAPREIDEVLYEHPKVKEAVTVGVPSRARGEIVKAYVVPRDGEDLTKQEVVTWCRERLANYKVPRQVEFRESLPKTLVGKILRRTLREEVEKQHATGENHEDMLPMEKDV